MKAGGNQVKVLQTVAADWKKLGLALEFDRNVLKAIERNAHFIVEDSCLELLCRWLDGKACRPVTWSRLIEAIKDAQHSKLATQLEDFITLLP